MPRLSQIAFTDAWLRKLPKPQTRRDHYDAICRGLGLRHAPTGLKTWFLMRRVGGRMTRHTLGRYPDLPLADARQKALSVSQVIQSTGRIRKSRNATFDAVFERWMKEDQAGNRAKDGVRRAFKKDVSPRLTSMDIEQIRLDDIGSIIDSIVRRGAPVHANRVLASLKRMFAWCQSKGLVASSPITTLEKPTRERSRDRMLSKQELSKVWTAAKAMGYPWGPFTQLLILTGQRRSEVAAVEWSEVDLDAGLWTQPGHKTKNGRSHVVHLGPKAVGILRGIGKSGPFVFSTTGTTPISGFSKAKLAIDRECGVKDWTLHDLRRTFASHATEALGASPAVVDKVLNHSTGAVSGIARVYQRAEYLEQRKELMGAWGKLIDVTSF